MKILSLPAESYIMKVHCSWCITTLGFTAQSRKFDKFINIHWNTKSLRRSFVTPLELFYRDFVDISYENASFRILETFVWLQLIYFSTTIVFFVRIFFRLLGTLWINYLRVLAKDLLREIFIAQISHYGKFTALHQLVSIVLELMN